MTLKRLPVWLLVSVSLVAGIVLWNGFTAGLEATNSLGFCTSCHQMDVVADEYRQSVHYSNPSGVRATCADCHVPKPFFAKLKRKLEASNDVYQTLIGTIDSKEQFEARRLLLAKRVWKRMQENQSENCRNCHQFDAMQLASQKPRARGQHRSAVENGETCIDCHQGITHKPVHKQLKTEESDEEFTL